MVDFRREGRIRDSSAPPCFQRGHGSAQSLSADDAVIKFACSNEADVYKRQADLYKREAKICKREALIYRKEADEYKHKDLFRAFENVLKHPFAKDQHGSGRHAKINRLRGRDRSHSPHVSSRSVSINSARARLTALQTDLAVETASGFTSGRVVSQEHSAPYEHLPYPTFGVPSSRERFLNSQSLSPSATLNGYQEESAGLGIVTPTYYPCFTSTAKPCTTEAPDGGPIPTFGRPSSREHPSEKYTTSPSPEEQLQEECSMLREELQTLKRIQNSDSANTDMRVDCALLRRELENSKKLCAHLEELLERARKSNAPFVEEANRTQRNSSNEFASMEQLQKEGTEILRQQLSNKNKELEQLKSDLLESKRAQFKAQEDYDVEHARNLNLERTLKESQAVLAEKSAQVSSLAQRNAVDWERRGLPFFPQQEDLAKEIESEFGEAKFARWFRQIVSALENNLLHEWFEYQNVYDEPSEDMVELLKMLIGAILEDDEVLRGLPRWMSFKEYWTRRFDSQHRKCHHAIFVMTDGRLGIDPEKWPVTVR